MKRDSALQPLSHQHHNALMGCLLLKKGIQKKADKTHLRDFTERLYKDELLHHMEAEEKFILPVLRRLDEHYATIIQTDHERLRLLGQRLSRDNSDYSVYMAIATLLEQHIRFEERVVFNKVQSDLSDPELQQIAASLNGLHARKCSDYPVKFWE